jgi:hypothetical protein
MGFVNNLRSVFGVVDKNNEKIETQDEKRFRQMIRELNTPKILPPEEYIDPYAVVWEGKGNRYGKKQQ